MSFLRSIQGMLIEIRRGCGGGGVVGKGSNNNNNNNNSLLICILNYKWYCT